MAAIENNGSKKNDYTKKGFVKKATRVDLTPMVDLGFLLEHSLYLPLPWQDLQ